MNTSHFLWQEQNQIFLNSADWVATYFDHPAWLACLAGDWLTQFYVYPIAGPLILSLAIILCAILFFFATHRFLPKFPSIIIALLLAVLLLFCVFPTATPLSFSLCIAGGLALGLLKVKIRFRKLSQQSHEWDLSPVNIILSFWLFGFGSLLTFLIIFISAVRLRKWTNAIASVVFVAASPVLICRSDSLSYSQKLLYPGLATPSLPETAFEKRLAIADAFYFKDFEKTKSLALNVDNPDDFTAFYYYLASAVKDSLPDNLLKYPVKNLGTLTTIGEKTPLQVINMMNDLYFELGDMTYAERAAMMRNVFSPRNRNVRMMKRLAEINLVSGDTLAALKYLRILDKTHAYSEWSRTHTPGQMSAVVQNEIELRRARSNVKDNIRLGDNCRNIILELLESNPNNALALDYLLCTDLLLKDMDTFKMDYDTYCIEKGKPRYKDLYQQALMIYLAGTNAPQEQWDQYIVSSPNIQRFQQYSSHRGNPAFSDTYWYYFDKL